MLLIYNSRFKHGRFIDQRTTYIHDIIIWRLHVLAVVEKRL